MPYLMEFYVDGACRGNGRPGSIGAAAACLMTRGTAYQYTTRDLPLVRDRVVCTNQRAEITAILLALEWALERYNELDTDPYLIVKIHSDSRYAIGCMSKWIQKWRQNGWVNAKGYGVANRDLIEKAADLEDSLTDLGDVDYIWVPREKNHLPDELCNEALDKRCNDDEDDDMQDESSDSSDSSDSDYYF